MWLAPLSPLPTITRAASLSFPGPQGPSVPSTLSEARPSPSALAAAAASY